MIGGKDLQMFVVSDRFLADDVHLSRSDSVALENDSIVSRSITSSVAQLRHRVRLRVERVTKVVLVLHRSPKISPPGKTMELFDILSVLIGEVEIAHENGMSWLTREFSFADLQLFRPLFGVVHRFQMNGANAKKIARRSQPEIDENQTTTHFRTRKVGLRQAEDGKIVGYEKNHSVPALERLTVEVRERVTISNEIDLGQLAKNVHRHYSE